MRALIVVRLSRLTEETTSPERQLEKCRELCEQRGWDVVGVANDLDVSAGSTSPFERPELGDWLKNRPQDFDAIVFFRVDRIVRRLFDLADLIRWARGYSVTLVSATESYFDLSTEFGDILALLVAKVAEMELSAISERNASAAQHNIKAGKYRGGPPPWGYLPRQDDSGAWRFVQDPSQVAVINEVVRRVLDGEPLRAIAHELTRRKTLTPRDRFAQDRGREVTGLAWHPGALKRSLTSPALLGQVVTREPMLDNNGRPMKDAKGKKRFGPETVVRGTDGTPIVRSEPILTHEVFARLGKELAQRENRKEPDKRTASLLVRVIHCAAPCSHRRALEECPDDCMGVCGRPAYRLKGGKGRAPRYRCSSATSTEPCGNRSVKVAEADEIVDGLVLSVLGPSERMDRVWDSGTDHSSELADINSRLVDLTGQLGSGVFKPGTPQRAALDENLAALAAKQAVLEAESIRPAGWTWQGTGENFGDWWRRQDTASKNRWLTSREVWLGFDHQGYQFMPINLEDWLDGLKAAGAAAAWRKLFKAMDKNGIAGAELVGDSVKIHFSGGGSQLWPLKA